MKLFSGPFWMIKNLKQLEGIEVLIEYFSVGKRAPDSRFRV